MTLDPHRWHNRTDWMAAHQNIYSCPSPAGGRQSQMCSDQNCPHLLYNSSNFSSFSKHFSTIYKQRNYIVQIKRGLSLVTQRQRQSSQHDVADQGSSVLVCYHSVSKWLDALTPVLPLVTLTNYLTWRCLNGPLTSVYRNMTGEDSNIRQSQAWIT